MEDLTQYQCSCDNWSSQFDHKSDCQLWACDAFTRGYVYWSVEDGLVPVEDGMDEEDLEVDSILTLHDAIDKLNQTIEDANADEHSGPHILASGQQELPLDGGLQHKPWVKGEPIYHTDLLESDPMMKKVVDGVIDFWMDWNTEDPQNFTYRGVTWVWETISARWKAHKVGCYCGTLNEDSKSGDTCTHCGVRVKYGKRLPLFVRVGEIACTCDSSEWYCSDCKVRRAESDQPWDQINWPGKASGGGGTYKPGSLQTWSASGGAVNADYSWEGGGYVYNKCRHYGQEVVFPTGLTVVASSHWHRSDKDIEKYGVPDFGFYLDPIWTPQCLAFMVPWADMGLPKIPFERVVEGVRAIKKLAEAGQVIEIGCIGGHGRTGTVLAMLARLEGVGVGDGKQAVQWVRDNYCKEAIESIRQEWLVEWLDCTLREVEPPEMPKLSLSTYGKKAADKGKYKGGYCILYQDSNHVFYCSGCQSDCEPQEPLGTHCFWCEGELLSKEEYDKRYAADKAAAQAKKEAKKQAKKDKSGPKADEVVLPWAIKQATGDDLMVKLQDWAEDKLWPEWRVKVWQTEFICSHCGDYLSWRYPSKGLMDVQGWVHRTEPELWLENCESGNITPTRTISGRTKDSYRKAGRR